MYQIIRSFTRSNVDNLYYVIYKQVIRESWKR